MSLVRRDLMIFQACGEKLAMDASAASIPTAVAIFIDVSSRLLDATFGRKDQFRVDAIARRLASIAHFDCDAAGAGWRWGDRAVGVAISVTAVAPIAWLVHVLNDPLARRNKYALARAGGRRSGPLK